MIPATSTTVSLTDLQRTARRLAVFAVSNFFLLLLGALAALLVFERYQPLDAGTIIRSFSLGLLVLWVLMAWKTWKVLRAPWRGMRAGLGMLVPALVPWVFAGFLFLNGALDRTAGSSYATAVVTTHVSSRDWLHAFRHEVVVRSWRPGRRFEGVLVREPEEFNSYARGDEVRVVVRKGFFGLDWISSLAKSSGSGEASDSAPLP